MAPELREQHVDNSAIWWRLLLNFMLDLKQKLNSLTTKSTQMYAGFAVCTQPRLLH